jgi:hypothetical protein
MNEVVVNFRQGGKTDKMCHDLSESSITKLPTANLRNDYHLDLKGEHAKELPIESEAVAELALDIYLNAVSTYESGVEIALEGYSPIDSDYEIILTLPLEYNFYPPISLTPQTAYEFTASSALLPSLVVGAQTETQTEKISINTTYELQLS